MKCISEHPRTSYEGAEADDWKTFRLYQNGCTGGIQAFKQNINRLTIKLFFTIFIHLTRTLCLSSTDPLSSGRPPGRLSKIMLRFRTVLAFGWTLHRNIDGLHLPQNVLTRAKAIHAPSMHVDRFTASIRGTTSPSLCTKRK